MIKNRKKYCIFCFVLDLFVASVAATAIGFLTYGLDYGMAFALFTFVLILSINITGDSIVREIRFGTKEVIE